MKLLLIAGFAFVLAAGNAAAADKQGRYMAYYKTTCPDYLHAYSQTQFRPNGAIMGPQAFVGFSHWVGGYLTAYNRYMEKGNADVLGNMKFPNVLKWLGSWCRDNPKKRVSDGLDDLILKLGSRP